MLAGMKVSINGKPHEISDTVATVAALLVELDMQAPRGIAVAKNMSVVPRSRWSEEPVEDGDEIEIVRATQGG